MSPTTPQSSSKAKLDKRIALVVLSILALAAPALAKEDESNKKAEGGPSSTVENRPGRVVPIVGVPDAEGVPSKDGYQIPDQVRKPVTFVGPEGAPAPQPGFQPVDNDPVALQRRMQELERQRQELARQYETATQAQGRAAMGPAGVPGAAPLTFNGRGPETGPAFTGVTNLPPGVELRPVDPEKQELLRQLQAATAQLNMTNAAQSQIRNAQPLPPDANLRAFPLRYVRAQEIAQALNNISGGGGARIAVDDRINVLLLAGTDKQVNVAEQLVKTLDQPARSESEKTPQTLQLRIVWLLDKLSSHQGVDATQIVSAPVLEALQQLGFDQPNVACQQITTLTLQEGRPGSFQFEVPVIVQGNAWQFRGRGAVRPAPKDSYVIDFDMTVLRPNTTQNSQLSGSIFTPLGHYTVMGTTTFVDSPPQQKKGSADEKEQHASAFVMYLDRAPAFPSTSSATPEKKK